MLRIERCDAVTTLTLDRPEVGNALDVELVTRLAEALAAAAGDPTTRVVVITGAGKSFSAGADLNYMRKMREAGVAANLADARRTQAVFAGIATLPRP
ncbi:MAG: enoyl-CoA hydratase/isomerase family protein, partial [Deltaproteobacteria bacterium]